MDAPLPAAVVEPPVQRAEDIPAASASPGWPIHLLMLLMGISGCGWFVLAAVVARAPRGLPEWVPQAMPGVGILHFAAAAGLWERRRWAWFAALLYTAAGLAALAPPAAAALLPLPRFLLALGSLALAASPALVLGRREFSGPAPSA